MDWQWLISGGILVTLALAIWARLTHQTIPELIAGLKELGSNVKEDSQERLQVYE
jgi:hypothetical protein